MAIFPNWGSLESVSRVHRWAEVAGIVILGLLVLAEVLALVYGRRKDTLVERQQAPRRLLAEQKQFLVTALSPFRGQKVRVTCILGNGEGQHLAEDFVAVFTEAHWDLGAGLRQQIYARDPVGFWVSINKDEAAAEHIPQALEALASPLADLGFVKRRNGVTEVLVLPDVPAGEIEVLIGRQPRPGEGNTQGETNP